MPVRVRPRAVRVGTPPPHAARISPPANLRRCAASNPLAEGGKARARAGLAPHRNGSTLSRRLPRGLGVYCWTGGQAMRRKTHILVVDGEGIARDGLCALLQRMRRCTSTPPSPAPATHCVPAAPCTPTSSSWTSACAEGGPADRRPRQAPLAGSLRAGALGFRRGPGHRGGAPRRCRRLRAAQRPSRRTVQCHPRAHRAQALHQQSVLEIPESGNAPPRAARRTESAGLLTAASRKW